MCAVQANYFVSNSRAVEILLPPKNITFLPQTIHQLYNSILRSKLAEPRDAKRLKANIWPKLWMNVDTVWVCVIEFYCFAFDIENRLCTIMAAKRVKWNQRIQRLSKMMKKANTLQGINVNSARVFYWIIDSWLWFWMAVFWCHKCVS